MQLETPINYINPVLRVNKWAPSNAKCNHCGHECQQAETQTAPNGATMILKKCLNQDHCGGEYGFY